MGRKFTRVKFSASTWHGQSHKVEQERLAILQFTSDTHAWQLFNVLYGQLLNDGAIKGRKSSIHCHPLQANLQD